VDSVLDALARNAASALRSARVHARTVEQATLDPLTGLANRRRLDDDLAREWDRARRYGRGLSICMLDLDHFKRINDGAGHITGDAWLRLLAGILRNTCRDTDDAYRYGGEEFLVLLPETGASAARTVAERLRQAVADAAGPAAWPHVTASLGVATLQPGMAEVTDLVAAADAALYAAKRGGRDRVEVAVPAPARNDRQPVSSGRR
jgi:diguanylate cyclase (GGDEF)-like protein